MHVLAVIIIILLAREKRQASYILQFTDIQCNMYKNIRMNLIFLLSNFSCIIILNLTSFNSEKKRKKKNKKRKKTYFFP